MNDHEGHLSAADTTPTCIGSDRTAHRTPAVIDGTTVRLADRDRGRWGLDAVRGETLTERERSKVVALALTVLQSRHAVGRTLCSPTETQAYLRLRIGGDAREIFGALFLDTLHRVLGNETLFSGTIDAAGPRTRVGVRAR